VSATARQAQDQPGLAERLGIKPGQVVQEIGYADDCDEALRQAITQQKDVELVDEDYDDVVDVVLLWWRDGDGDLFDALADALTPLADGGYIWLLTPKPGRENYVEPSEIGEVAPTAGLSQTSSLSAGRDWLGTRLVAPRARRWTDLDLETAMDMVADRVWETRSRTFEETRDGRPLMQCSGIAHLGGATLDNEENYLIKKLFTGGLGMVAVSNQARI